MPRSPSPKPVPQSYDADTQRYTFTAANGTTYTRDAYSQYYGTHPPAYTQDDVRREERAATAYLLPAFLFLVIAMFGIFRLLNMDFGYGGGEAWECHGVEYPVQRGDVCSGIAEAHGVSVAAIEEVNEIECDNLRVGEIICIPRGRWSSGVPRV